MLPGGYNNNIQVFQAEGYVVLLAEMVHDVRVVPLDGRPHLPSGIRQWLGSSRGRWEGNTLVVETTNFTPKIASFSPMAFDSELGRFRSMAFGTGDSLHLTERFTRTDAGTLEYEFTIDDPQTFTRTLTGRLPMNRSDCRCTSTPATRATTACSTSWPARARKRSAGEPARGVARRCRAESEDRNDSTCSTAGSRRGAVCGSSGARRDAGPGPGRCAAHPWGHPDLQGMWDHRTITPLERPEELGDREFLTEEEAASQEQAVIDRNEYLLTRPPETTSAGGSVDQRADGTPGFYNNFWLDTGTRTVGTRRTSLVIDPPNGRLPAYSDAGRRKVERDREYQREHPADSWLDFDGTDRCLIGVNNGPPILPAAYNQNLLVVQNGGLGAAGGRDDPHGARHSAGRPSHAAGPHAAVGRGRARPLGGRYAGRRDGELRARAVVDHRQPDGPAAGRPARCG